MSRPVDTVSFISVEDEDDFVVSFYITSRDDSGAGRSLSLLRDRKLESLVAEEDKGVKLSDEGNDNGGLSVFVTKISFSENRATLETDSAIYELDTSKVDPSEVSDAKSVLEKMNFDNRFELELA